MVEISKNICLLKTWPTRLLKAMTSYWKRKTLVPKSDIEFISRVGENLDEASGINKNSGPVMGDGTKETKQIVSSWNRQKDKTTKVEKSVVKVKPQLVFQDKPDNSSLPFVPKLYKKVSEFIKGVLHSD